MLTQDQNWRRSPRAMPPLGTTAIWHSSFRKMTGKGWSVRFVTMKSPSEEVKRWPCWRPLQALGLSPTCKHLPTPPCCACSFAWCNPCWLHRYATQALPKTTGGFQTQTAVAWTAEMVLGLAPLSWMAQITWELPQQTAVFQANSWKGNKTLPIPILTTKQKT